MFDNETIAALSLRLGGEVKFHSAPGGRDRKTVLCQVNGQVYAISRRKSSVRARLEAEILRRLGPSGVAPNLVARLGDVVVQEFVEGKRLTEALHTGSGAQRGELLMRATKALAAGHEIGRNTGLDRMVPVIGARPGWEEDLAAAPSRLGKLLELPVPSYDFSDTLTVAGRKTGFVKWDARPGNAIVRPDGGVCWIDWEHAGVRRPLDDLVWLMADEWTPEQTAECDDAVALIANRSGESPDKVKRSVLATAVAHSCIRLTLIRVRKKSGPWWSFQSCLKNDRVGVTKTHVQRVSQRAAAWAEQVAGLEELAGFLRSVPTAESWVG